MQTNILL